MEHINIFIVFFEGILSIFSPCILPILPIYLSMLANSSLDNIQKESSKRRTLITNTIFFTIGIAITFFILGSTTRAFSSFFIKNKSILMIIGSIFILLMGLFYLDVIKINFMNREKRFNVKYKKMSPISAFVLGFTFSFGWTPCIGPILASVLVMASSSDSAFTSYLLILVYTIGFIVPFILTSLFYSKLYEKFNLVKKYMNEIKKISGAFIIIAGIIMLVRGITDVKREINLNNNNQVENNQLDENNNVEENESEDEKIIPIDFTLYDQYGDKHTLSEYKGKTVFLNIWATWCPPCRAEMPYINELYEEYNKNQDDVIILGLASPDLGREGSKDHIIEFLEDNKHTFPVVFDEDAALIYGYGISSFPSTFIIDSDGYLAKYIPGGMEKETMQKLIEEVREEK